ncbi:MAG: tetratricopeptide repeat protein, partial [Candidatus Lokiarchaeota archaeon]|nr:tetratricopeptide repeat protein [Candidatus Lokiarchaeota archaeon]
LLGSYYREIGEYRQAEEIFFRLIRNQSYIKFLSGDFSHFLLIGDDAKDFRNLFALLTELGLVYFEGGEYENAIEQFLKVIKFYRNIPSSFKIRSMAGVYLRLGEAYQALGFKRKAFKAFDEALKLDPSSLEALTSVGKMYLEMGRYKRAFDLNEKCLSINPNFDPALKLREKLDQSK